ncbi:hypothetical protein [Sphingobacterium endophyticum]|uniref:hypothetical protein n=1 Tax=Sphingobacterium endophyticum TaxID=2546448 RepID=UPI0012E26215|nr:hypothetical protein [Sphingobacterium endophyticum]
MSKYNYGDEDELFDPSNFQEPANTQLLKEEFNLNCTIEITDLYKRYFNPLDITFKSIGNKSNLTNTLEEQHQNFRIVNETFYMVFEETEDGRFYHDDSRIYEFISLLLFKKDLNVINAEEKERLNEFFNQLIDLFILFKVDYWNSYYSQYHESLSKSGFNEDIEEITYLRQLLDKWENISNVEISLRKKDEYGSVIISETQKVKDDILKLMLEPFIKRKYYDFINSYKLEGEISNEEKLESKLYSNEVTSKFTLTSFISEAIAILNFEGIKPSMSFEYFDSLYTMVHNNTHFETRLTPTYEFLKVVVPALNSFLEDHAIKGFKKKHKHMLIFSLLRSFSFIPDKKGLELNGNEDVKEDFVKQLLR